jgi:hypothetical protein
MLALLAVAAASTGALPEGWEELPNTNCVYSRLTNGPGKDSGDVHYLGTFDSVETCVAAAHVSAHHKGGTNYHSLAWHGHLPGSYYQQCYGVAGKEWSGNEQHGVTSLRGPGAVGPPAPVPPPPPSPLSGPCTDDAGCNHNGKCAAGKCTCVPQFTGVACDRFNFKPLDVRKGTGLRSIDSEGLQISSWGGSVHLAEDGKMHMCTPHVARALRAHRVLIAAPGPD